MQYFARAKVSVFKELKPVFQVRVKPNGNNEILIPNQIEYENKIRLIETDMKPIGCTSGFSCLGGCSRMDRKIVKLAFYVLEKQKIEKFEESEKDMLKERICNIETALGNISEQLNTLLRK